MGIKHLLLWLPMILIAFANATLRELVFVKQVSELRAHQLSTITLILLCAIYIGFVLPVLQLHSARQALLLGLVWTLLTVAFEFSLGRLTHKSWDYLLRDYNLFAGRLWLLFLLCFFFMPYLFYMLKYKQ